MNWDDRMFLLLRVGSGEIAGSGMVGEFEREELPHSFPSRRCTSEENPNLKAGSRIGESGGSGGPKPDPAAKDDERR